MRVSFSTRFLFLALDRFIDYPIKSSSCLPQGFFTRKNCGVPVIGIGNDGFCVPTVFHVGFGPSALVDWRMKPGPLLQETITLLPVLVMVSTGETVPAGATGFWKSTKTKLKSASRRV